jgi:hypothetical protein
VSTWSRSPTTSSSRPSRHADPDRARPRSRHRPAPPAERHRAVAQRAAINLSNAGFLNYILYGDLAKGNKNKIQAQNPDATQGIPLTTLINMHYRPN